MNIRIPIVRNGNWVCPKWTWFWSGKWNEMTHLSVKNKQRNIGEIFKMNWNNPVHFSWEIMKQMFNLCTMEMNEWIFYLFPKSTFTPPFPSLSFIYFLLSAKFGGPTFPHRMLINMLNITGAKGKTQWRLKMNKFKMQSLCLLFLRLPRAKYEWNISR